MICPVCGAETSGDICTTCGTRLSGTSSFNLQGNTDVGSTPMYNNLQQPVMDDYSDLESQPYDVSKRNGTYSMNDMYGMNGGMNGYPNYSAPVPTKSKSGSSATAIIVIIFMIVAVAAFIIINKVSSAKAIAECEKLIDNYMTGLEEGDSVKLVNIIDPDAEGGMESGTMVQLASAISTLKSFGAEISVDYKIIDHVKASERQKKSMCADLYGDAGKSKRIGKAYIFEVEMTMKVSVLGESQSNNTSMYIFCYEKDGYYYIWTNNVDVDF